MEAHSEGQEMLDLLELNELRPDQVRCFVAYVENISITSHDLAVFHCHNRLAEIVSTGLNRLITAFNLDLCPCHQVTDTIIAIGLVFQDTKIVDGYNPGRMTDDRLYREIELVIVSLAVTKFRSAQNSQMNLLSRN